MEERTRNIRWVLLGIVGLFVLFLCTIGGAVAGGLAVYFLGPGEVYAPLPEHEYEVRLEQLERELQETRQQLERMGPVMEEMRRLIEGGIMPYEPLPWEEMPPEGLPGEGLPPGQLPGEEMMNGALITEVIPDTPAAKAGLMPGDLILTVDDQRINPAHPLPDVIARYEPKDRVVLTILREGVQMEVRVRLGEHPEDRNRAYLGVWAMTFGPPGRGEQWEGED